MMRRSTWLLLVSFGVFVVYFLLQTTETSNKYQNQFKVNSPPIYEEAKSYLRKNPHRQKARASPLYVGIPGYNRTKLKSILYWNEFYGRFDTYDFGYGHSAFTEKKQICKFTNCFATQDRNLMPIDEFDAVIIHIRGLPNDWPKPRNPKQRYVFLAIEPPLYLLEYKNLKELKFNWTMTYRLDSDFPVPYAWIDQVKPLPGFSSQGFESYLDEIGKNAVRKGPNVARAKNRMAVFFASNCHSASRREVFVRELQRYISVDIYGKCGDFRCPKERSQECYRKAASIYKFILVFEDSICQDYLTERFFSVFGLNMIPVVMGGANYSSVAPAHSFVDVRDFDSPRSLAHYLQLLDSNDARFNEYFWWRPYFQKTFKHHNAICDLCERLNTDSKVSIIPDMNAWWVEGANCQRGAVGSPWFN